MTMTFCPYCLSADVVIMPTIEAFETFRCQSCRLRWSYQCERDRRDIHEALEAASHEVQR